MPAGGGARLLGALALPVQHGTDVFAREADRRGVSGPLDGLVVLADAAQRRGDRADALVDVLARLAREAGAPAPVRHDREALAELAGVCRLDGRVQRQHLGLERDHLHVLGHALQLGDEADDRADLGGQHSRLRCISRSASKAHRQFVRRLLAVEFRLAGVRLCELLPRAMLASIFCTRSPKLLVRSVIADSGLLARVLDLALPRSAGAARRLGAVGAGSVSAALLITADFVFATCARSALASLGCVAVELAFCLLRWSIDSCSRQ